MVFHIEISEWEWDWQRKLASLQEKEEKKKREAALEEAGVEEGKSLVSDPILSKVGKEITKNQPSP